MLLPAVLRIRDVYPRSRILDPDFYPSWIPDPRSRIPDPKTATKERDEKKFVVIPFNEVTNFTKFKIILVLKCWRKKCGPIFKELQNFLPKKLSLSSQQYGFGIRDPRSGIRDLKPGIRDMRSGKNLFRIADSGVNKAPDPGSAILVARIEYLAAS
jgi:hypothetical protein